MLRADNRLDFFGFFSAMAVIELRGCLNKFTIKKRHRQATVQSRFPYDPHDFSLYANGLKILHPVQLLSTQVVGR